MILFLRANRSFAALSLLAALASACGGSTMPDDADAGTADGVVVDRDAGTDTAANAPSPVAEGADGAAGGACASAATTEACVQCCRQPDAPNYGGFELAAYDTCKACSSCDGLSPCATNATPPATASCVQCLKAKIATTGLTTHCARDPRCASFARCLETCPLR